MKEDLCDNAECLTCDPSYDYLSADNMAKNLRDFGVEYDPTIIF